MPRASTICPAPGCPSLRDDCTTHRPTPWQGSTRRRQLPRNWRARRQKVLTRDRWTCQTCGAEATQVDHRTPGGTHHPTNLVAICDGCHTKKSSREGNEARWATRR